MDSDTEAMWVLAASGQLGKKAQLREYQRQLQYLPKWLKAQQRVATQGRQALRRKIKKLQHG